MATIQIKNIPPETHAVLRRRAAEAHQSLQEYMRAQLIRDASRPTLNEVLARAGNDSGGSISLEDVVRTIREDRDSR